MALNAPCWSPGFSPNCPAASACVSLASLSCPALHLSTMDSGGLALVPPAWAVSVEGDLAWLLGRPGSPDYIFAFLSGFSQLREKLLAVLLADFTNSKISEVLLGRYASTVRIHKMHPTAPCNV